MAGVLDACSRRIVGWAADDTMPAALVARAFERAVQTRQPSPGLLHPSGRGSQYASDACRARLRRHGVIPSMSRPANCYDNAKMESFRATLKGELIGNHVLATRAEAKSAIFRCIEVFYNRTRLHGARGFYSPVDFERNLNENINNPALRLILKTGARSGGARAFHPWEPKCGAEAGPSRARFRR